MTDEELEILEEINEIINGNIKEEIQEQNKKELKDMGVFSK